ncbi:hypothetical protein KVR01_010535 [Diaporthe batatas]|uniref:uncharacterized protein n=1 Tax=Diaporthe batatas TaxID=748121 RepID=UPI001D05868E|nr:uncharacterized protein KVR01_010535 [Diaporthe batatas]KAG8159898.1 hypothetical protein KVR01_010535 [Diaporthe batatas]
MLGALDAHRAVLPSQRPPSPPSHPHSHPRQPMHEYVVHHDAVGPSPYEDSTSNTSNSNSRRDDYLARLGGREPLQESTGNVQHHQGHHHQHHHPHYPYGQRALPSLSAASSASCTPVLSHALSAIPAAPILPTQALGSTGLPSSSAPGSQQDQHHHHNQQQQQQQQQHQGGGGGGVLGSEHNAAAAAAALVAAGGTSALRLRRHQHNLARAGSRHSVNPVYLSPEFRQYRTKQKGKDEQKWPDILEDAFLDALLLIVHMGRRKYHMHGKQHGRNMLICEYIWIAWKQQTLPPGAPPPPQYTMQEVKPCQCKPPKKPHREDEQCWVKVKHDWYRERKQVSSHIQVIKNFFRFHPAYHFFFSKGSEESGKDKKKSSPGRWYKENTDQKSFKDDPVLNALKEDRLPDVRPNYEYFGQLLGMNQTVQVSPSMCWLYLSNDLIRDQSSTETRFYTDEDGVKREEEVIKVKTYHPEQGLLPHWDFPHRYEFTSGRKEWGARDKEDRSIRQTFLHEYNWDMKQTESSSVREVCDEWEVDHPELHASLQSVIDHHDLQNAHVHSAAAAAAAAGGPSVGAGAGAGAGSTHGQCDIIHMDLTLDVHGITKLTKLPKGSAFRPLVKITVAQASLQSHHWCVRTRLERPPELCSNGRGTTFKDDLEMGYVFTHVRGCHDRNPTCDCRERRRGNVWSVPFPEVQWAEALDLCATYPRYFLPREKEGGGGKKGGEDGGDDAKEEDVVTQMDLLKATAMFQELWSSPPAPPGAPDQLNWTRRAVILWTFNTIHFFDKEKKLCTTPAGTNWRFLTAVDPLSPMHQERMLLSGSSAAAAAAAPSHQIGDRVVMSPSPTYQQMLNAQMAENFSSAAWPGGNVHLGMPQGGTHSNPSSMPVSPMPTYGPSNLSLHGGFANGLVTPPPSAALTSSYVAAFDAASSGIGVHAQDLGAQGLGFMPATTSNNTEASFMTSGSFSAESYMPYNTGNNSFYEEPEDDESDTTLPGCEAADLTGLATQQWSSMNSAAHAGNNALAALDWGHPDLAGGLSMAVTDETGLGGGDTGPNPLDDGARQMQNPYDACAQVVRSDAAGRQNRTPSSEHYLAGLQRMHNSLETRERLEQQQHQHQHQQQHRASANDDDLWNTSAPTPTSCDVGGGGQDASAQFSQSAAAAGWDDSTFGHQFHQQQQPQQQQQQHRHHDGLSRSGQEYLGGSGGLSPLVGRKRSREEADGDDAYSSLGSMAGYVTTAPAGQHKNLRYRLS